VPKFKAEFVIEGSYLADDEELDAYNLKHRIMSVFDKALAGSYDGNRYIDTLVYDVDVREVEPSGEKKLNVNQLGEILARHFGVSKCSVVEVLAGNRPKEELTGIPIETGSICTLTVKLIKRHNMEER